MTAKKPKITINPAEPKQLRFFTSYSVPPWKSIWCVLSIDWVNVLRPTRHKTDHSRDVLPSETLGIVLKKSNLAQHKQTTQEQNGLS